MNKKILPSHKRVLSFIINIIISLILSLVMDNFVFTPLFRQANYYKNTYSNFESLRLEYENKQDDYHIYTYNEDGKRVQNTNVSDEEKEAFSNDEEVISIYKNLQNEQQKLTIFSIAIASISFIASSLIYFTFSEIICAGRSLPFMIYHCNAKDENEKLLKINRLILYGFLKWLFTIFFGVLTVFILPIIMLKQIVYDEKKQTFLDKKLNIIILIDEAYIGD